MDHTLGLENVDDSLNINQRTAFSVCKLGSKLGGFFWVDAYLSGIRTCSRVISCRLTYDILKEHDIVGLVTDLCGIWKNLVELASFRKCSHDLSGNICTQVNAEGKVQVMWSHNITQLLGAVKLVLLHPFLQKMLSVLGENRPNKLKGFVLVESSLIQKHAKVL